MIKEINLNINDIVINKKSYKGETPFKIMSINLDGEVLLATLDRVSFEWDYDFKHLTTINALRKYYKKLDNFDSWLSENKEAIYLKEFQWRLERIFCKHE